uniref:Serine-threonine/tyrosine-protein kinase catalytic domain-containing protein n=1 Tax=Anopheles dirus TaxID=7168 RepID=A0A182NTT4_9DIPT
MSPTVNSFKTASLNGVGLHVNGGGDLNMPGGPTATPGTPNTKAKVMKKCWSHSPEDRPGFRILKDQLAAVAQGLTD